MYGIVVKISLGGPAYHRREPRFKFQFTSNSSFLLMCIETARDGSVAWPQPPMGETWFGVLSELRPGTFLTVKGMWGDSPSSVFISISFTPFPSFKTILKK